jgi:DNA-binding NarL/FixJ family response regulator
MTSRKKVLIIEPSVVIVEGLVKILNESTQLEICPPLHDIESLKRRIAAGKPDLLLLNPTLLPAASRRQALNNLMQDYPNVAVVALVYQYVEQEMLRMCHGIVDIREERNRIFEILLESTSPLKSDDLPDDLNYELTKRELDVLVLVARGLMSKEIADRLNISIHTVISHRKNITRKTNIKSVAGLAMYALMNNLVEEGAI